MTATCPPAISGSRSADKPRATGPNILVSPTASTIPNSEFRIPNSREAGYTLAIFLMVIAVMAIMMAVAVQTVSFQMQREKEAELIFRGQQYVEGIRLFKQKYGRYPMQLKEMWEANPKVLRQKWIDPMTGSENWGLVHFGEDSQQLQQPWGAPGQQLTPTPTRTPVFSSEREGGPGGGGEKMGPIIGVYSLADETSIKVYEGRTNYREWKFIYKEDQDRGGGGSPGGGRPPRPNPPPQPRPTGTPPF
jgi:type II secretory pathway pseudopilin PulG